MLAVAVAAGVAFVLSCAPPLPLRPLLFSLFSRLCFLFMCARLVGRRSLEGFGSLETISGSLNIASLATMVWTT